MHRWKKALVLTALAICLVLSACSEKDKDYVRTFVPNGINHVYLGKLDPVYLALCDLTEDEAEAQYLEGMGYEAQFFCEYWDVITEANGITYDDLDEDLQSELVSLYQEIYSHMKYEVTAVERRGRRNYDIELTLYPIDIMERALALYQNDGYAPLNAFYLEKADAIDTLSGEELLDFYNEYGKIAAAMVRELLPELDYDEPVTITLNVSFVYGYWMIDQDDWDNFDDHVISYPWSNRTRS